MKQHKTVLPSPFSVSTAVTFYHIDFSKKHYGGEWHDFPEMIYVDRGSHQVIVDGELFEILEGQALIYAPNAYHVGAGASSSAVVDILSFETDFDGLRSLCNRVITLDEPQKRLLSAIMTQGLETFANVPSGTGERGMATTDDVDEYEMMKLKNRIELLLLELYTDRDRTLSEKMASNHGNLCSDEINAMTKYFRENLDRTLTQEDVANHLAISVSKLKSLCREQLGCGPITYFSALKLGEAKKMICNSSKNFSQIAEALGFGSIHHFSKFFKEKTGLTPSEYARSIYKK